MNLGDIFWTFRGDGAKLQADAKTQGAKAGATLGQSLQANIQKSFTGANLGKGLVQGLGLAGGLGIANVVSKFVDVVGEAVQAAREDQQSQQALGTALRNNIPAWNGNTDAIEKTLAARIRLGVSDDEQRIGLATLVGATHDATKALELEAGALDIARARGVDLATASDAVAKAYAGNTKGLKSLLPGLKLGANSAETLANAFGMVKGAAEDFAKTDEGKVLAAQTRQAESLEKLGYVLMPAFTEATVIAANVTEDLAGNLDGVAKAGAALDPIFKALGVSGGNVADNGFDLVHSVQDLLAVTNPTKVSNTLGVMLDTVDKLGINTQAARQQLGDLGLTIDQKLPAAAATTDTAAGKMADDLAGVQTSLSDTSDAAVDWRDKFRDVAGAVIRSADKVRRQFIADAKAMIDGYYDPLETRANLHDTRLQLLADKETLRLANSKEERRQARDDIIKDLHDEADALIDLAGQGQLTADDVKKFASDARSQYGSMSKSAIADTEKIIAKLQELAGLKPKVKITLDVQMSAADKALLQKVTHHAAGHGPLEFGASGGRFAAGTNLITGEDGWEMMRLLPGGGAEVISHPQSVAALAGATAGASDGGGIHVHLEDRLQVRSVRDIADGLRMVERQGYLRRAR